MANSLAVGQVPCSGVSAWQAWDDLWCRQLLHRCDVNCLVNLPQVLTITASLATHHPEALCSQHPVTPPHTPHSGCTMCAWPSPG